MTSSIAISAFRKACFALQQRAPFSAHTINRASTVHTRHYRPGVQLLRQQYAHTLAAQSLSAERSASLLGLETRMLQSLPLTSASLQAARRRSRESLLLASLIVVQRDPFESKEVYNDTALDRAAIWLVSDRMKRELGSSIAGKEFESGYGGFVQLSNEVMKGRSSEEQRQLIWKILRSLLPEEASDRFKSLFPLSKWSAELNARITKAGFYWLVGQMEIEPLEVDFGGRKQTWQSGVKIKKCRYLEASGCKAMCINMCKRPTQEFFTEAFGLPLTMVPDFSDLSCEMRFGEVPPPFREDDVYAEPCFSRVCTLGTEDASRPCPKIDTTRRSQIPLAS